MSSILEHVSRLHNYKVVNGLTDHDSSVGDYHKHRSEVATMTITKRKQSELLIDKFYDIDTSSEGFTKVGLKHSKGLVKPMKPVGFYKKQLSKMTLEMLQIFVHNINVDKDKQRCIRKLSDPIFWYVEKKY